MVGNNWKQLSRRRSLYCASSLQTKVEIEMQRSGIELEARVEVGPKSSYSAQMKVQVGALDIILEEPCPTPLYVLYKRPVLCKQARKKVLLKHVPGYLMARQRD